MSDALYFFPILAKAFEEPDALSAMMHAFRRIREMGDLPQHWQGFLQFERFMEEVAQASSAGEKATEALVQAIWEGRDSPPSRFVLTKDGAAPRQFDAGPLRRFARLDNINPGFHSLSLDTGRVLWEGELTESHLLWAVAFPGEPLQMAADTGEAGNRPTLEDDLLDGEMVLRVFPGLEGGSLEVEMRTFVSDEEKA